MPIPWTVVVSGGNRRLRLLTTPFEQEICPQVKADVSLKTILDLLSDTQPQRGGRKNRCCSQPLPRARQTTDAVPSGMSRPASHCHLLRATLPRLFRFGCARHGFVIRLPDQLRGPLLGNVLPLVAAADLGHRITNRISCCSAGDQPLPRGEPLGVRQMLKHTRGSRVESAVPWNRQLRLRNTFQFHRL